MFHDNARNINFVTIFDFLLFKTYRFAVATWVDTLSQFVFNYCNKDQQKSVNLDNYRYGGFLLAKDALKPTKIRTDNWSSKTSMVRNTVSDFSACLRNRLPYRVYLSEQHDFKNSLDFAWSDDLSRRPNQKRTTWHITQRARSFLALISHIFMETDLCFLSLLERYNISFPY